MSRGAPPIDEDSRAVFSFQIGDLYVTTHSRPIVEGMLPASHDSIMRLEGHEVSVGAYAKRIMADFSRDQPLKDAVDLESAFRKAASLLRQQTSHNVAEYRVPDVLGWARGLMSQTLYETVFEPYVNDLLAIKLERLNRPGNQVGLTLVDRCQIAIVALSYSVWAGVGQLLRTALKSFLPR